MRGATCTCFGLLPGFLFQSTRPMRGATILADTVSGVRSVSIHAPHAGRDMDETTDTYLDYVFQSTRPMRGATNESSEV